MSTIGGMIFCKSFTVIFPYLFFFLLKNYYYFFLCFIIKIQSVVLLNWPQGIHLQSKYVNPQTSTLYLLPIKFFATLSCEIAHPVSKYFSLSPLFFPP